MVKLIIGLSFFFSLSFVAAQPIFVPWGMLKNPVYQKNGWATKDACVFFKEDEKLFYLFFSAFFKVNDLEVSHVACVTTKNWIEFSEPLFVWDNLEKGWLGMCSPEIHFFNGKYILTYNKWGDKKGEFNQLYYAVSDDMKNWSRDFPLAEQITKGFRAIDAALAFHNNTYFLFFKESIPIGRNSRVDQTRVAFSKTLDSGWKFVYSGYPLFVPKGDTLTRMVHENFRLIEVDKRWCLQTTDYEPHNPYVYWMTDRPDDIGSWLVWKEGAKLSIPVEQNFNTATVANAGHLVDWRKYDGYFYLLYAGTTENDSHAKRGNNKLGLARSKDLITWEVP